MQMNWQPSATLSHLTKRAALVSKMRAFFADRQVMEVDTPLMCHTSVTDPMIESIPVLYRALSQHEREATRYYLQTSPEYAMKRLLAAGSGSIYQLSKAFRQGEVGRHHNPEFSMLEWYRVGFDHHALMDEVDALLRCLLDVSVSERVSYADAFFQYVGINPHKTTLQECKVRASHLQLELGFDVMNVDDWLHVFMSHCIEPQLGRHRPCFVYDFPISLAALSRIVPATDDRLYPVAARFEVYYKGIELANGFHELCDANEQRSRFVANMAMREQLGLAALPLDEYFLGALAHGLPDCSGVALGFDRLVMLALGHDTLQSVLSFDFSRV